MGKKRVSELGSENEAGLKAKHARQLEQKKLRSGKGLRVADMSEPSPVTTPPTSQPESTQSTQSPKAAKKVRLRSKPYLAAKSKIDSEKTYSLTDGLTLLRTVSLTKFDPTIELHLTLKDKGLSKQIELPHPTGKTRHIAIVDDALLAEIQAGKINFDLLIASPADMPKLVKLAKILGPRGLMPNPKNGTVVDDPKAAAKKLSGQNSLSLKTEKDAPVVHTLVGKLSHSDKVLSENITSILSAVPQIRKAVLKSTMSPAIKIRL